MAEPGTSLHTLHFVALVSKLFSLDCNERPLLEGASFNRLLALLLEVPHEAKDAASVHVQQPVVAISMTRSQQLDNCGAPALTNGNRQDLSVFTRKFYGASCFGCIFTF